MRSRTYRLLRRSSRLVFAFLMCVGGISLVGAAIAATGTSRAMRPASSPSPGTWTMLGPAPESSSEPTLLHVGGGRDLVLWTISTGPSTSTFEYAELGQDGGLSTGITDLFAGHHWTSLIGDPKLLEYDGQPLLVFAGQRTLKKTDPLSPGCVIGAADGSAGWKIQSWSLSQDCAGAVGKFGGAAIDNKGALSAAWASNGSGAIEYRIGVAPTIPASSPDSMIPITHGNIELVDETNDSYGNNHFYAAWYRLFSTAPFHDGLYIADLSVGASPKQAPGSGTLMEEAAFQEPALTSTIGHGGVYAAYCSNTENCSHVELWKYGAQKAMAVPGSSGATVMDVSAGPSGRLWVAWYNRATSRVYTVRTNKADNRFGPVESYAIHACTPDNNARLVVSHGPEQRLDVVLVCVQTSNLKSAARTTQSITGLSLDASTGSIRHKTGGTVRYVVTDAGDPVAGATVTVDRRKGKTNAAGAVKFSFPKGARLGRFTVTATMGNYYEATGRLLVE